MTFKFFGLSNWSYEFQYMTEFWIMESFNNILVDNTAVVSKGNDENGGHCDSGFGQLSRCLLLFMEIAGFYLCILHEENANVM